MIVEFSGTARQRGQQHGEALRDQIRHRVVNSLPADVEDGERYRTLAQPWLAAIKAHEEETPLSQELRGIAEGSGVALHAVVLLNAFEAFALAAQVELGGCTAVGVPRTAGSLIAQNWDANPSLGATVGIHVHRASDQPATVFLASPGGLGWIGMNEHGVALVTNDLLTRQMRPGLPSQAARRRALAARDASEAVTRIVDSPAPGGRAYLIGDANGAVATVELAAEARPVVEWHVRPTTHTNHAGDATIASFEDRELVESIYPSSRARRSRAELLAKSHGLDDWGIEDLDALLADHDRHPLSICRHEDPSEPTVTAASVIFDCEQIEARIGLGPACQGDRVVVRFD